MKRLGFLVLVLVSAGCPDGMGKHGPGSDAALRAEKAADAKPGAGVNVETPKVPNADAPDAKVVKPTKVGGSGLGKVLDSAPLAVTSLLGKAPTVVQPLLGEPTGKGMARSSCVRFVPERVWFDCKYAYQRYSDTTGKFDAIQVTYEDGVATAVGFEGAKGGGEFSPQAALKFVGLELPGAPTEKSPNDNTKVWSWFNSAARLVIEKKQHRVTVSAVDNAWNKSLVEVTLNHPLTKEQQASVKVR